MSRGPAKKPRPDLEAPDPERLRRAALVRSPEELGAVVAWRRAAEGASRDRVGAEIGVSADVLRSLEEASRGVRLPDVFKVLQGMGFDFVLVPRARGVSLHPDDESPAPDR